MLIIWLKSITIKKNVLQKQKQNPSTWPLHSNTLKENYRKKEERTFDKKTEVVLSLQTK